MIFVSLFLGIIAIVFSVLSSSSADDGDLDAAKTKGKISLAMSLIGIFSTILLIIIIIVYIVAFAKDIADSASSGCWMTCNGQQTYQYDCSCF